MLKQPNQSCFAERKSHKNKITKLVFDRNGLQSDDVFAVSLLIAVASCYS